MSSGFVSLMGMGIVFTGLVSLVFICKIMSILTTVFAKSEKKSNTTNNAATSTTAANETLPAAEKRAIIAGVCAVIAEELGTDANNIRVLSFKKA